MAALLKGVLLGPVLLASRSSPLHLVLPLPPGVTLGHLPLNLDSSVFLEHLVCRGLTGPARL